MAWTNVYDTSVPDGATQKVPVLDDAIKTLAKALQERLNVCFYFPLTGTQVSDENAGKIRKVIYKEAITKPTLAAGEGALYTKTVNGIAELFWQQADGTEKQLTTGGKLKVIDTDILLTNAAWLVALNAAGDGNVNLIKAGRNEADDADVAVLPDLVRTATDAAPTEDTQIPNRKFVIDQIKAHSQVVVATPKETDVELTTSYQVICTAEITTVGGTLYVDGVIGWQAAGGAQYGGVKICYNDGSDHTIEEWGNVAVSATSSEVLPIKSAKSGLAAGTYTITLQAKEISGSQITVKGTAKPSQLIVMEIP